MPITSRSPIGAILGLGLSLGLGFSGSGHASSSVLGRVQKDAPKSLHASGTFDVTLTPQVSDETAADTTLSRMSIDKQFHGDLEGTSKGQMLSAGTRVKGSAGYVAIETVSGTLHGRNGTFVLQHAATMTRGTPHLTIIVVPDSGTGQLVGLAGTMTITIADGKHSYTFDYTIARTPLRE